MVEIARKNDDGRWDSNIVGVLGERIQSFSLNNLLPAHGTCVIPSTCPVLDTFIVKQVCALEFNYKFIFSVFS